MARVLVVATGGAGGDLPPLMAASMALRERGHETTFVGDAAIKRLLDPIGVSVDVLPAELDLGPRMAAIIQGAMQEAGGELAKAGPIIQRGLAQWANDVAGPLILAIDRHQPVAMITSLFGVEAVDASCPPVPWAVINSTFYIGPNPPRPLEEDFNPRVIPLIRRYADLLEAPDLVLHATDQVFDYSFDRLPSRHHYVGPLIWEPREPVPTYLDRLGNPWVLVSISSQRQDDIALAQRALDALADQPVRVLLTVGPEHDIAEIANRPPNAFVEKVVSHAAVLRRAALLVSHAGHGTVMKALWYGVPTVLIPWGRDQPGVAARAQALGVAIVVPRPEADEERVSSAIVQAQHDADFRSQAHKQSERLRQTDPPTTAARLLETIL